MNRVIFAPVVMLNLLIAGVIWADQPLYRMRLDGPIGPTTAACVGNAVDQAQKAHAACLVVEIDTPGGLDTAMRQIVKCMLNADVPVVVYVSPPGSRAASAGAFIAEAAHVAAMAPGTNIGAAHPVSIGGAIADSTMAEKVGNDAAAYMRSLAEKRGRNADIAVKTVRESASFSEREALRDHLIDLVAPSFAALQDSLQGRRVETPAGPRILQTAHAPVIEIQMGFRERLLSYLSDPNIAYILMLLGIYGLIFELSNPGAVLPGIIGGICLILAFYAFQTLPINYAGLLLILLGIVLLILEIKVTSYGLLTLGGLAALALGSTMLVETPDRLFKISGYVMLPALVFTAFFFTLILGLGLRAQQRAPYNANLVGQTGIARTEIEKEGMVFINGEYWQAYADQKIAAGTAIQVVAADSGKLKVQRA